MNDHRTTTTRMCLAAVTDRELWKMRGPEARAELIRRGLADDPAMAKRQPAPPQRYADEGDITRYWRRRQ
jgi:hypothetical protein